MRSSGLTWLEALSGAVFQQWIDLGSMKTLVSASEWFIAHCADHRKLSPHTTKAYRQDLAHLSTFISGSGNEILLATIDRNLVQRWLGSMIGAQPRTVRRRLATLKSMFASLERHGGVNQNPLAGLRSEVKVGLSLPVHRRSEAWGQHGDAEQVGA